MSRHEHKRLPIIIFISHFQCRPPEVIFIFHIHVTLSNGEVQVTNVILVFVIQLCDSQLITIGTMF